MKSPRTDGRSQARERAYSGSEFVKLLKATKDDLAPGSGGYAATFWEVIRLALLTGTRANELLGLTIGDVIEDGTALAVASQGRAKTDNTPRIIPPARPRPKRRSGPPGDKPQPCPGGAAVARGARRWR
jgi:integrase